MVQNIEDFSTEFQVDTFVKTKTLVKNQIKLLEVRTFQRVSRQVSKSTRRRDSEGCRVKEVPVISQIWIHARN